MLQRRNTVTSVPVELVLLLTNFRMNRVDLEEVLIAGGT